MTLLQIVILAAVQGAAELLPVSSSAHVIVVEKLMGLDPSSPELTFFLVMLHTGTMFAVLVYFWKRWAVLLKAKNGFLRAVILATAVTGALGLGLKLLIEKIILVQILGHSKGEIESLFRYLPLVAGSLFVVGLYIIYAGRRSLQTTSSLNMAGNVRGSSDGGEHNPISDSDSIAVGLTQALCLPFRGLSRSGATISTALLRKISRPVAEDFSFALAVVLTPPVIVLELHRLMKSSSESGVPVELSSMIQPGLIGMVFSFIAGLLALKWLSRWLENGKWTYFGIYCVTASFAVIAVHFMTA